MQLLCRQPRCCRCRCCCWHRHRTVCLPAPLSTPPLTPLLSWLLSGLPAADRRVHRCRAGAVLRRRCRVRRLWQDHHRLQGGAFCFARENLQPHLASKPFPSLPPDHPPSLHPPMHHLSFLLQIAVEKKSVVGFKWWLQ